LRRWECSWIGLALVFMVSPFFVKAKMENPLLLAVAFFLLPNDDTEQNISTGQRLVFVY
jgi:hypothetical protein